MGIRTKLLPKYCWKLFCADLKLAFDNVVLLAEYVILVQTISSYSGKIFFEKKSILV